MTKHELFRHLLGLTGVLVALAVVLFAVAQMVATKPVADDPQAVTERIRPVGADTPLAKSAAPGATVAATAAPAPAAKAPDGKTVYATVCQACHAAGIAGAPKFGDKTAWGARIAQGKPVLYRHALSGFTGKTGVMPPKGGYGGPDADVKAAVDYMVGAVK
jgi:cytochrome c5